MSLGGGKVNRRTERSPLDYYPTPSIAVEALLNHVQFEGDVWEPACGEGHISKLFEERGYTVRSSDLGTADHIYGEKGVNFLTTNEQHQNIVTNPPYTSAESFLKHALKLADHKVAMLLRLAFIEGQKRKSLFTVNPPAQILVMSKRLPWWNPETNKWHSTSGQFAHAWFVWDKKYKGPTIMNWT